jgi:hypothetical protein
VTAAYERGTYGVLPLIGSVLFFIGSGNGVLYAHHLGSLFGLVNGARVRLDLLTKECQEQRIRMRCLAEQLCENEAAVLRTIDLVTLQVARDWPLGTGSEFTVYLLCKTIATAQAQALVYSERVVALDPDTDDEHRVVHALYDLCGLDIDHIARILHRDTGAIEAILASAPPAHQP